MEKFFEIFADSFQDAQPETVKSNVSIAVSDLYPEDLLEIKQKLAARNMRPGKFIGVGNVGVVFQLETTGGKPIKNAVLRIDPQEMLGHSDTCGALRPLYQTKGFFYAASVVPKAEKIPGGPTMDHLKKTLAVINAEDHLEHVSDLELSQLMHLRRPDGQLVQYQDGTPAAIIVDINAVNCDSHVNHALGNIASFAQAKGLDPDTIKKTKVSKEEIDYLRQQQLVVNCFATQELHAAGINLNHKADSHAARLGARQSTDREI